MTLSEKAKFRTLVNEVILVQNQTSKIMLELMKLLISINDRETKKTQSKEDTDEKTNPESHCA